VRCFAFLVALASCGRFGFETMELLPGTCTHDDDCAAGVACKGGVCESLSTECHANTDCATPGHCELAGGATCNSGRCDYLLDERFFVSPTGSAAGDGSLGSPWDLQTALDQPAAVQAGTCVWMLGGTYSGSFVSNLDGAAGAPVILRQYPGEHAVIDGNVGVLGSYSGFWGFEVMSSDPTATSGTPAINDRGVESLFVNLVIHDSGGTGLALWGDNGSDAVGCVSYNNGTQFNNNHGIHPINTNGTVRLVDNIVFNNWAYGIHAYSSTANQLNNLDLEGNVTFGNGSISTPAEQASGLLVGGTTAVNLRVSNNFTYEQPTGGHWSARLGVYTASNQDAVVENNTFVSFVEIGPWASATFANNTFYAAEDVLSTPSPATGLTWTSNAQYRDPTATAWQHPLSTPLTFAAWKVASGLGASDTTPANRPSGVRVIVRPNAYERGRANIVVYNWDGAATTDVDVSAVLRTGDAFEVRNAQQILGAPVASGIYDGTPVTLPLGAATPPAPIGRSFTAPAPTGPDFNVFILLSNVL
jgi:parallel beta-helix repeat protein